MSWVQLLLWQCIILSLVPKAREFITHSRSYRVIVQQVEHSQFAVMRTAPLAAHHRYHPGPGSHRQQV